VSRQPFLVAFVFLLYSCQAAPPPTASASPVSRPDAYIDYRDPNNPQLVHRIDWSGKAYGTITGAGLAQQSPNGLLVLAIPDLTILDSGDVTKGRLAMGGLGLVDAAWADDSRHLCLIASSSSGENALWEGAANEPLRRVASVSAVGPTPSIAACSVENDRAVVVAFTPQRVATALEAIRLTTGDVVYGVAYAVKQQVQVVSARGGNYIAENSPSGAAIRRIPDGKVVLMLSNKRVIGFSWPGDRILVAGQAPDDGQLRLMSWADQRVVWEGHSTVRWMMGRPRSEDVVFAAANQLGFYELISVSASGKENVLVENALGNPPCPCPGANA
jgi:hypothetical protein